VKEGFFSRSDGLKRGSVLQTSWKRGCVLHMTASGEELRAKLVEPAPEMLQTVFLFFKVLNTQQRAKIGDSRVAWNVV